MSEFINGTQSETDEFKEMQDATTRALNALERVNVHELCQSDCEEHVDREEVHGAILRAGATTLQLGLMPFFDDETGPGSAVKVCELMSDDEGRAYRVERTISFPEWGHIRYTSVPYDVAAGAEVERESLLGVHEIAESDEARQTFLSVVDVLEQDVFNVRQ